MLDDQLDDQLKQAAQDYNSPPDTPKEAMWAAISARRGEKLDDLEQTRIAPLKPARLRPDIRVFRWPAAIAALLAIGVGLGRLTAPHTSSPDQPVVVATEPVQRMSDVAYRLVTTEHLSQSEAFLTLFRASIHRGGNAQLASATARQLLASNRLLLDSPAAADNRTRLLLQDLELVLAQIAQLSGKPASPDLDLITEGLEDSGVMSRLRTAVPSGTSATQGVL